MKTFKKKEPMVWILKGWFRDKVFRAQEIKPLTEFTKRFSEINNACERGNPISHLLAHDPADLLLYVVISGQRPWDGEPAAHTCHRSLRGDTRSSPRTGTLPRRHTGKAASLFQPRFAPSHLLPWSLSPAGVLQCRKGQLKMFKRAVKVQNG